MPARRTQCAHLIKVVILLPWVIKLMFVSPAAAAASGTGGEPAQAFLEAPLGQQILVPIDHDRPSRGTFSLYYELGAPFDPAKPTVILVADAVRPFVKPGRVSALQAEWLGDRFNVIGLPGRMHSPELLQRVASPGGQGEPRAVDPDGPFPGGDRQGQTVDWREAYRLFGSRQWCGDLDAVRQSVLGQDGEILLLAVSSGACLAQEYLTRHGMHCPRAVLAGAANPFLDAELGIVPDPFWEQIGESVAQGERHAGSPGDGAAKAADLREILLETLRANPARRLEVIAALARQADCYEAEELRTERARLITALGAGDWSALARASADTERAAVGDLLKVAQRPVGIPLRVRLYELTQPVLRELDLFGSRVYPGLELCYRLAEPLFAAEEARRIHAPRCGADARVVQNASVLLLASRWDPVHDYRMQIELARRLPAHTLLVDDDPDFRRLKESGLLRKIISSYLAEGMGGPGTQSALADAEPLCWKGLPEPPPMPVGDSDPTCSRTFMTFLREHVGEIQAVAAPFLRADSGAGGTVHVRMVWEGEQLVAAKVLVDDTRNPAVAEAVLGLLRRWRIPGLVGPCDISVPIRIRLVTE